MSLSQRLLIVDDSEANLELLSELLEDKGFEVTTAPDGRAALDTIDKTSFDAIVLDLQMPGMDGLDVLQALRQSHSQVALPVIMATALADSQTMVSALEAGANDYVTKPIEVDVLVARLRAQIRSAEVAREAATPVSTPPGSTTPAPAVNDGSVVANKYRLQGLLGSGGFGSVYRAQHLSLQTDVALKVLHPHLASAHNIRRRFEQEGISAVRVKHPNAVTVFDAGTTEEGLPFLVMEVLTGITLAEELERLGTLKLARVTEIIAPVCEVLEAAHRAGIIHRDVKPANIMLCEGVHGEVVKVLDFGIANYVEREKQLGLTGDGIAGTPLYMSPEALLGRPIGTASDVFSVGVTLFLMLAGVPPHGPPAKSPFEQAIRQVNNPPTPLADLRPDLPVEVTQIVMAALAQDPANRPSLADIRKTLTAATGSFVEPLWPPSSGPRRASTRPPSLAEQETAMSSAIAAVQGPTEPATVRPPGRASGGAA